MPKVSSNGTESPRTGHNGADGVEPWNTTSYRFVPVKYLHALNVSSDPGLATLLYLQMLISEEVESKAPVFAAAAR